MKDYREMAMRYLKKNKWRSLSTIAAVVMCVAFLFCGMSLVNGYLTKNLGEFSISDTIEVPVGGTDQTITVLVSAYYVSELLIAYIFALFSVGVVRNAIQLTLLEQCKDFGMLRCIGATTKQIRSYIFVMGVWLEVPGIVVGELLGYVGFRLLAGNFKIKPHFFWSTGLLIVGVFLLDLFFVVGDNAKSVDRVSPAEAVAGNFVLFPEKILARRKGIWGALFGIEGEYAEKSLMRNPKRFFISIGAMGFGVAAVLTAISFRDVLDEFIEGEGEYGYYQFGYYEPWQWAYKTSPGTFPPKPSLQEIQNCEQSEYVTAGIPVYCAMLYMNSKEALVPHLTEEYLTKGVRGNHYGEYYERVTVDERSPSELPWTYEDLLGIVLMGYEGEDYERLQNSLAEGTIQLSENGILLVNSVNTYVYEESSGQRDKWTRKKVEVSDYRVGDTIEVADFAKLGSVFRKKYSKLTSNEKMDAVMLYHLVMEAYEEVVNNHDTKTYVIEGILEEDPLIEPAGWDEPVLRFILPKERYLTDLKMSEDMISGYFYHMKGEKLDEPLLQYLKLDDRYYIDGDDYIEILLESKMLIYVISLLTAVICFISFLCIINVFQTTASNLQLRKLEFAQLRVLGMSQKKLMWTVMLEGVITSFGANVIGLLIGFGAIKICTGLFGILMNFNYTFPVVRFILIALGCTLANCICIYFSVKQSRKHTIADLAWKE